MSAPAAEPRCPHSAACPGCPGLGTPYERQRAHKHARVVQAFADYAALADVAVAEVVSAAPTFGYRTRAKLVARAGVGLGMYARGGHELVVLDQCGVLAPEVGELVDRVRVWLRAGLPIEALDVASAGAARLVTLIAAPDAEPAVRAFVRHALATLPDDVHVAISKRAAGPQLLGTGHALLRGDPEVRAVLEPNGPYHYQTHGGFTQAHRALARVLYAHVRASLRALAGEAPRVLELYAGAGALALSLAHDGCAVTAVEAFAPAVSRIERAAHEQSLSVTAHAGDAGDVARGLAARGARFDAVLVNPPRRGLSPEVREAIHALAPRALVYVSCSPETLARDLAYFAHVGLRVRALTPFDMIPQSEHVESVAVLVRAEPAPPTHGATDTCAWADRPAHVEDAALAASARAHEQPAFAPPRGFSGPLVFAARSPEQAVAQVLARGVTHKGGRLGPLRYRCVERVGGHSLLHVAGPARALGGAFAQLRRLGHPVVGDPRDAPTARHFAMRHGLDRPFAHVTQVDDVVRPLAPDLAAALASLRRGDSDES